MRWILVAAWWGVLSQAAPPASFSFEAPDWRCRADADCTAVYQRYQAEGSCCHSCTTQAVRVAWAAKATAVCEGLGAEGCPLKKCLPLQPVACRAGACVVLAPGGGR